MDNDIEPIYKKFNYTSNVQKLLKLVKSAGITATINDIKTFLNRRVAIQQTKITKKSKANKGHIVSFKAFDLLEMDIFVLDKYNKQNKGYGYIFAVVDVFSRKAYAYPMKHKTLEDTTAALKQFFDEADVKKYKTGFSVIVSDSDSAFLGGNDKGDDKDFQKVLTDNNCIHDTVPIGDHNALAIVDRWARTLKTILTKVFLENGNTKWSDELDTIVDNYNNTPHDTLDDHTPNEALKDEAVRIEVMHDNMDKNKKNAQLQAKGSDLSIGDHVRVSIANFFKKGTEPRYSDEIYTVEGIKGMTITLNDDKTYKRDKLLKIPKDTIKITDSSQAVKPNVIKQATKQHKQHLILKAEDIKADNIQTGPRDRVANKQLNDFVVNPKAAPKANVIMNSNKVKNKEETKAQDKLAFQKVLDFVKSNKKKDETITKHK